jgi:hypothetical protein
MMRTDPRQSLRGNQNYNGTHSSICSPLEVDRFSCAGLQSGFAECLGQRRLLGKDSSETVLGEREEGETYVCVCRACDIF